MADLTRLMELNDLARAEGGKYPRKRDLYTRLIPGEGRHFTGILGPRGVGKTILLKQMAFEDPESFYISLDTLEREEDLFEVLKKLNRDLKFRSFLLDEVHFIEDFDARLKKVFDFLDVRVVFTSSMALALHRSAYDLSRRVRLFKLFPFSFREYAAFKTGKELPVLSFDAVLRGEVPSECMRNAHLFEDYLKGGNLPFALEEPDPLPLLRSILDTVLEKDVPSTAALQVSEIERIRRTVAFICRSEVDGINYSSTARNVGITKYKAAAYLRLLEQAFIVQQVFPRGTNVLKEPKVLLMPPYRLLFRDYSEALGGLREDFAAAMLAQAGLTFHYLKTRRGAKTPDFLVLHGDEEVVIEIGGKGKGRSRFKGIQVERKVVFSHEPDLDLRSGRRPLFLLGFLA